MRGATIVHALHGTFRFRVLCIWSVNIERVPFDAACGWLTMLSQYALTHALSLCCSHTMLSHRHHATSAYHTHYAVPRHYLPHQGTRPMACPDESMDESYPNPSSTSSTRLPSASPRDARARWASLAHAARVSAAGAS